MAHAIQQLQAPRINRASAMIKAADALVESGNSDSAILLYVTSFEIIGEALLLHNNLQHLMKKGIRKHQARHFIAATLIPGLLFSNTSSIAFQNLDFSTVRYELCKKIHCEKSIKIWVVKGDAGPAYDILRGLYGSSDRSAWSEDLKRISALISLWRDAAFGHWDNYRLALIHQDNTFEFLEYQHDGVMRHEKILPVESVALTLCEIAKELTKGLCSRRAMEFVARHAASLFDAFYLPLRTKTYE